MNKFLANENVPKKAVEMLRRDGFNINWVGEYEFGLADDDVMILARKEDRILLTFDKDFGDLVYRRGLAAAPGVILLRFRPALS